MTEYQQRGTKLCLLRHLTSTVYFDSEKSEQSAKPTVKLNNDLSTGRRGVVRRDSAPVKQCLLNKATLCNKAARPSIMTSILANTHPHIAKLLIELHALSEQQDSQGVGISNLNTQNVASRDFSVFKDKMVALEQDKSELIYTVLRQKRATRIFEAGTSYGVSTIYLVLAALESAKHSATTEPFLQPTVWGTEKEAHKAQCARDNLADAFQTSSDSIPNFKLLQGDILEQVADARIEHDSIDAVLFDIWAERKLQFWYVDEHS